MAPPRPPPPASRRSSLPPWGSGPTSPRWSLGSSARPQSTRSSPATVWWSIPAQQGLYPREPGSSSVRERGSGKLDEMFSGTRFPGSPRGIQTLTGQTGSSHAPPQALGQASPDHPRKLASQSQTSHPPSGTFTSKTLRLQGGRPRPSAAVAFLSGCMDRPQCGARSFQPTGPHRGPHLA